MSSLVSFRAISATLVAGLVASIGGSACSSSSSESEDENPTFAQTIEPLVQEKCQKCHRAGGVAPFSLETYEDVKRMGALAKEKVRSREMPPWGAFDDATCKVQHPFKDNISLTDEQIEKFTKWVDAGMPLGDASRRPAALQFAAAGLVDKTHTFAMSKAYEVQGGGKDDIRCFPLDPGFTTDQWVGASNVVPGDPAVVHHVIVFVDPEGKAMQKAGPDGSYQCFGGPQVDKPSLLLAWAPGVPPATYGEEAGLKVPKGSHLVMQVHYHPHANLTKLDQSSFELKTLPYKPGYVAQVLLVGNAEKTDGVLRLLPGPNDPPSGPAFVIPPNVGDHTESMVLDIPTKFGDVDIPEQQIATVGSHMHWAGVDMKIEIERKNPSEGQPAKECLLGTPRYDFNWQRGYSYDEAPEKLPRVGPGDKLTFTCKYNNTTGNPYVVKAMSEMRLASPPEIKLGESTLDEMCLGVLITVRRATLVD